MMLDRKELERLLPKVGDVRMEVPTVAKASSAAAIQPQKCKVVQVNREHLWYRVQFEDGITECYKVPDLRKTGGAET